MPILLVNNVEDMLRLDESFFGTGKVRAHTAFALNLIVNQLPTFLGDLLAEKPRIRIIAEARRRFILESKKADVHEAVGGPDNSISVRLLEKWNVELKQLDELINRLDQLQTQQQVTEVQVMTERLQLEPETIQMIAEGSISSITELLYIQPSVICWNPGW